MMHINNKFRNILSAIINTHKDDLNITSDHWGNEAGTWEVGRGIHWMEHIAVQERINNKSSGDPHIDPYQYFINYLKSNGINFPLARCLTLGCGAGDLERGLSKYNFCLQHDACDISDGAIKKAKEKASEKGLSHISYEVVDVNEIRLPPCSYNVVFGVSSIHHLNNLEYVFSEIRKSLNPDGFFFLNEYVGPTKFQWSDKQLDLINHILSILPEKYRISRRSRILKTKCVRPTIVEMNTVDPSEAVRSEDIMKLLPLYFDIIDMKLLGGTILHSLLEDIVGNFDWKKDEDIKLLKLLFEIEDTLIEIGEIESDFILVIAKNKS